MLFICIVDIECYNYIMARIRAYLRIIAPLLYINAVLDTVCTKFALHYAHTIINHIKHLTHLILVYMSLYAIRVWVRVYLDFAVTRKLIWNNIIQNVLILNANSVIYVCDSYW